jgi:hypothetical protein
VIIYRSHISKDTQIKNLKKLIFIPFSNFILTFLEDHQLNSFSYQICVKLSQNVAHIWATGGREDLQVQFNPTSIAISTKPATQTFGASRAVSMLKHIWPIASGGKSSLKAVRIQVKLCQTGATFLSRKHE